MSAPAGWQAREGTLARELALSGHGLHTGRRVRVRILPADGRARARGVAFRRMQDGRELATLAADPALRRAQPLCTMLRNADGVGVRTVEHLLASLLACEIDHATVELDAEEVPILDGSARPWVDALRACGRAALPAPKRFIRVLRPVVATEGDGAARREMRIEPAARYELSVRNDLKGFGDMHWRGVLTPAVFAAEIAPSRSYGRVKWAIPAIVGGYLRGVPILRGARPSCTASIVGSRVVGGLRQPDEFVRHRVLDLIGDLALAGAPLLGRVSAFRPSHEMNFRLVEKLLSTQGAWEWAEFVA
ncbi:UDP-3-O-acyl N-acetylglycosamine deacetylase [Burkholderia oklahomensis]|uniref:UDP-3-O-acyl-N-acetylglucosamine deacetylase n=2 Tax=Burkholderia oklahomensis TaxID=342113 RepID=A0AAI8B5C8_9BURK|nr:UDP-3-O-acyl N-acetylglycosamine deacetylase [Burkholderia oklahomensis]AIO65920.1 UDP-3-O-acyl N-acetylglycosamine deacetylase family protein [Burkholderia oklahomensis]AOI41402.1 UDP-3-O-[3-hydroxymyristoyl] N-acetylglucosamine deacetylase [Burkholderia oklahomensis EO147]KUY63891.1 UDP-3-O-[3-hydroxymyristoyl] N-acetylglucosamine deacetylase [Burkholderia oklahomensis EO147]QPS36131.1 UDP-3-O-acyl N-acetylglycosamine deacetylase [Burkholderia oklahomensis]